MVGGSTTNHRGLGGSGDVAAGPAGPAESILPGSSEARPKAFHGLWWINDTRWGPQDS